MSGLTDIDKDELIEALMAKILRTEPDGDKVCPGDEAPCWDARRGFSYTPLPTVPSADQVLTESAAALTDAARAIMDQASAEACAVMGMAVGHAMGAARVELTVQDGRPAVAFVRMGDMADAVADVRPVADMLADALGMRAVTFTDDGTAAITATGRPAWTFPEEWGVCRVDGQPGLNQILERTAVTLGVVIRSITESAAIRIGSLLGIAPEYAQVVCTLRDGRMALAFARLNLSLVPT